MKRKEEEESNRNSSVWKSRASVWKSMDFDPELDSGPETADDDMSVNGLIHVH